MPGPRPSSSTVSRSASDASLSTSHFSPTRMPKCVATAREHAVGALDLLAHLGQPHGQGVGQAVDDPLAHELLLGLGDARLQRLELGAQLLGELLDALAPVRGRATVTTTRSRSSPGYSCETTYPRDGDSVSRSAVICSLTRAVRWVSVSVEAGGAGERLRGQQRVVLQRHEPVRRQRGHRLARPP